MIQKLNKIVLACLLVLVMVSCNSSPSLQEYYVNNAENADFIALDLPVSLLNLENVDLTTAQKEALNSLKKLNVLAFRKTLDNDMAYKQEKEKVSAILKGKDFIELMKLNSGFGKGVIKYVGDDDAIDEVIIYADRQDKGFALVRVLGRDMNPANLMQLLQALQKSNYKGEGLEGIQKLLTESLD
ncbi:protein of unknown function [Arenibacter nanhaiticus]|uniref:DUF4252 domain-containing protein n=1 Tax=Arenibacter nanhaiticus TaxID=558155 RepID=A0A1M6EF73_9FLAO|nr:DUF4252 domain-containing protein [Arenibacter nanhaiticus]SHI83948.1 protein of unknown function [Arenibacter nanhaiticus]